MLKLINLFENPEPWIIELNSRAWYNDPVIDNMGKYHYVYCWVNMDTQWCYVGKHSSSIKKDEYYLGNSSNDSYWNSRKFHIFKLVILGYEDSEENALLLESLVIDQEMLDLYSNKGLYNFQAGGLSVTEKWIKAGRAKLLELYPETNGAPRSLIEAGAESHSQNSIIRSIKSRLQYLKDNNYDVNAYNYYHFAYPGGNMWNRHIPRILSRLPDLINHPEWTEEMTNIFSKFIPNPTASGSKKYSIQ